MMIRCGACRASFDVPGAGRHQCPACGATNQVTPPEAGHGEHSHGEEASAPMMPGGAPAPPPVVPPAKISDVVCPDCGWEFMVGEVDVAICPNCRAEVSLGATETDS